MEFSKESASLGHDTEHVYSAPEVSHSLPSMPPPPLQLQAGVGFQNRIGEAPLQLTEKGDGYKEEMKKAKGGGAKWGGYVEANAFLRSYNLSTQVYRLQEDDPSKVERVVEAGAGAASPFQLLWTGNHYDVIELEGDEGKFKRVYNAHPDGNCLFYCLGYLLARQLNFPARTDQRKTFYDNLINKTNLEDVATRVRKRTVESITEEEAHHAALAEEAGVLGKVNAMDKKHESFSFAGMMGKVKAFMAVYPSKDYKIHEGKLIQVDRKTGAQVVGDRGIREEFFTSSKLINLSKLKLEVGPKDDPITKEDLPLIWAQIKADPDYQFEAPEKKEKEPSKEEEKPDASGPTADQWTHIWRGDLNEKGSNVSGYHWTGKKDEAWLEKASDGNVSKVTESGFYEHSKVQFKPHLKKSALYDKIHEERPDYTWGNFFSTASGGVPAHKANKHKVSSFFPDDWSEEQVKKTIAKKESFVEKEKDGEQEYEISIQTPGAGTAYPQITPK